MENAVIRNDGWSAYNIWEHSESVRYLYVQRARDLVEEMTCAAQAAEILASYASSGDSVLDVGCGSGYFFHSLRRRDLPYSYYGIDATKNFIDIGRSELAAFGFDVSHLQAIRIEDFVGEADHVLCMNTLSNLDNFHRPLERILKSARKSVVLRESITDQASYAYVRDDYLDSGVDLNVYVNAYARDEIAAFMEKYGFSVQEVLDRRTEGRSELVIGYAHYWAFLVATRK